MLFRNIALFLSTASTMVFAQDANPAFISSCGPKTWAMTFDDGPFGFTEELLGYLAAAKVKATFFVLGVQLADETLRPHTKAAFDAGHMIASHSQTHADFNKLTPEQMKLELSQANAQIKKTIGVETNYFRPPLGNCNAACAAVLKEMNYTAVTWNVDSNDWRLVGTPQEEDAFKAFTTALEAANAASTGHISLQHDIHGFSVKMVPRIIAAIAAKGNTFVTVDKCGPNLPPAYRGAIASQTATPTPAATPPPVATSTSTPKPVKQNSGDKSTVSVSLMVGSVLGAVIAAAL